MPVSAFSAAVTKLYLESEKWMLPIVLLWMLFEGLRMDFPDASPEKSDLTFAVSTLSASRMLNNVKGIYHEIAFAHQENSDNDEWFVELSVETNDLLMFGCSMSQQERIPYQLKASDSSSGASSHYEKYDTQVLGTDELVSEGAGVQSSGFSNAELTEQTEATAGRLEEEGTIGQLIEESVMAASVAGAISFSIRLGIDLRGGKVAPSSVSKSMTSAKEALLTGGLVAAVTELVI